MERLMKKKDAGMEKEIIRERERKSERLLAIEMKGNYIIDR